MSSKENLHSQYLARYLSFKMLRKRKVIAENHIASPVGDKYLVA